MPNGDPQVCELWETTDPFSGRTARAVVADLAPNVITFVSLTGSRTRISPNRLSLWRFLQAPPAHGMGCSRRGCRLTGVFRIDRDTTPEWVCPRHMPVGTQASLDMSEHPGAAEMPQAMSTDACPACDDRATSGMNRVGSSLHLWSCSKCNYQWGTLGEPPGNITDEWYFENMIELRTHMQAANMPVRRIDITPTIWGHFYRTHEREVMSGPYGARAFQGTPILVSMGPESLHSVMIQTRDVGRSTALPVSRLGGQPGRPSAMPASNSVLLDLVRELLPIRSGVVFTSNPPSFPRNPLAAPSQPAPEPPEVDPAAGIPEVMPSPGDEWEHTVDKTGVEIISLDASREIVHVAEIGRKRLRSIPLRDFASGSWRKIVRRTSFEHLMDDEI